MTKELLEHHEFASIFPLLAGDDLAALAADISANGLRDPIVLLDGRILDGRNRHVACIIAGIEPRFETWKVPETALDFVISKNLRRRHLDASQRAMCAAEIANLKQGNSLQRRNIAPLSSARQSAAPKKRAGRGHRRGGGNPASQSAVCQIGTQGPGAWRRKFGRRGEGGRRGTRERAIEHDCSCARFPRLYTWPGSQARLELASALR